MTRPAPVRRRGMATFVVVAILGVIAIASGAMTVRLAHDARLTRAARTDAQLRHLLMAGGEASLQLPDGGPHSIALPSALAEQGYTLHVQVAADPHRPDHRTASVSAAHLHGRSRQRILMTNDGSQWRIVAMTLER